MGLVAVALGRQPVLQWLAVHRAEKTEIEAQGWVSGLPDPDPEEILLGKAQEMAVLPEAQRERAAGPYLEIYGEEEPLLITAWLELLGMTGFALQWLDEERGSRSRELFAKRLELLVKAGLLDRAEAWLENPPVSFDPVPLWLMRAQIARVRDDGLSWRRSMEHAFFAADISVSQNEFFAIYDEALRFGDLPQAARAALRGVSHPLAVIPPSAYFDPVLAHLWESGELLSFEDLLVVLRKREPHQSHLFNNHLYLELLYSREEGLASEAVSTGSESMSNLAQKLVDRHPDVPTYRTTAALAFLSHGDGENALRILEGIHDPDFGAADHAIAALVYGTAGNLEEAAARAGLVQVERLNSLEQRTLWEPLDEVLQSPARSWRTRGLRMSASP